MAKKHDVIIVGMGLASLAAAARLNELGVKDIGIYTTAYGGTPYIAAINFVLPDNPYGDTIGQYNDDMIHAGYGINNKTLVQDMAASTMEGYKLLCRWGVEFAKNEDGTTKLRHLSGHTYPRSLCCTTELIGVEIVKKLVDGLEERGIPVHMGYECVRVLTEDGNVRGITVKNPEGGIENIYAPVVVAGWGGVGNLFGVSTYPGDIKGNTLAIAKAVSYTHLQAEESAGSQAGGAYTVSGPVEITFATQDVGTTAYVYASTMANLFTDAFPNGSVIDVTTTSPGGVGSPVILENNQCNVTISNGAPAKWACDTGILGNPPTESVRGLAGGLDKMCIRDSSRAAYRWK